MKIWTTAITISIGWTLIDLMQGKPLFDGPAIAYALGALSVAGSLELQRIIWGEQ